MKMSSSLRDTIHPGAKLFMDDGSAESVEAAVNRLKGFAVTVVIGDVDQASGDVQNCLLTLVNAGARTFLGGVRVVGLDAGQSATTTLSEERLLIDEVRRLGGSCEDVPSAEHPVIVLGGGAAEFGPIAVRPIWKGWSAAVMPADETPPYFQARCSPLAPIAAAALALAECFDYLRGANVMAGQRNCGINLLTPGNSWFEGEEPTFSVQLPQSAWLLGVGHLGQGYLWALASLPYPKAGRPQLTVQDFDKLTERNMGTSLLCHDDAIGRRKTRAVTDWLERRGFETSIVERRFNDNFKVADNDPRLLLCGVDNAAARMVLEDPGFPLVLEAGIGAGVLDFMKFRCHAFDGSGRARQVFHNEATPSTSLTQLPAYRHLRAQPGADDCGVVTVAGAAVAVPFVGAFVGALLISEAIKAASGQTPSFVSYGSVSDANNIRHVEFDSKKRFRIGAINSNLAIVQT